MPFNGSGQYNLPAGSIVADGTTIDAADLNTPLQDIEASLSQTVLRNGAAPLTGPLSAGGNKVTNLANGTVSADAVNLGQVNTLLAGKANLSGGNTFSGDQVLSASATSGNTPRFVLTNTGGGTPDSFGPSYVLQNGVAGTHGFIVTEMQSSGSEFVIANSDSPFTQYFRITQNGQIQLLGALGFNGANYGTTGQIPVSNGSGSPPTWGSHINLGTAVNTTSGTAIDFTGLPAGIKRLTLSFSQLSTSGTSPVVLRIGSGSFLATGYLGGGGGFDDNTGQYAFTSTDGFALGSPGAANVRDGTVHIVRTSSTLWSASGIIYSNTQEMISVAGSISFSGDITGVRLTTSGGANTFDNGTANILWEF